MGDLRVPGAHLSYDVQGAGPLLVLVPGAAGDGAPSQDLASELSARFRVATYARRGFSRSELHGTQDYAHRLQVDADDLRRLVAHLSDDPATVFGNSSGALVALQLLIDHPAAVATVIAHEPPAVRLLSDVAHADRLVLACGRESKPFLTYHPAAALAEKLGKKVLDLPGGHLGLIAQSTAFASELLAALR